MAVTVDIFVKDDAPLPAPIQGAVVSVLNSITFVEVAQSTTDVNGKASFLLPGSASPGTTYEVRIFKLGVRFGNPVLIQVQDPLGVGVTNIFDVSGTLLTLPAATDPRRCRCTGRFFNFSNEPIPGAVFRVMAKAESGRQVPKVVDGNMISAEVMIFHTDDDGMVSMDLLRGGEYYITFSGDDDVIWNIVVPDRTSVNLVDLIHPKPVSLAWDSTDAPGNAVSVAVGQIAIVKYTITFSDYQTRTQGLDKLIQVTNSDGTLAEVGAGDGQVGIKGLSAGAVLVTVASKSPFVPSIIPEPAITAPALTVTITP